MVSIAEIFMQEIALVSKYQQQRNTIGENFCDIYDVTRIVKVLKFICQKNR